MERAHRTALQPLVFGSHSPFVTRSLAGESISLANKTSPTHLLSSILQYIIQPPTYLDSEHNCFYPSYPTYLAFAKIPFRSANL